ncbi:MAG: selenide, water dikinase SelD [Chloracidobacterium sp.]|nr:selenide, water dikinase SelD [Chloracidobacterium sp.]MDW8218010.1 selenide, water dikinase SelD [Acidobacteriota bacterium]
MSADAIRLTKLAKRAGCAAKQPPGYLFSFLSGLPPLTDPNVLVGSQTADDAAVYRLSDDLALVLTTDFFTPIVDDPADFGAIAAANALSDVYAMGGEPRAALNLVGFPDNRLEASVLGDILRGAMEIAAAAGVSIVGGHTIKSDEPIYGLAVVGVVSPDRMLTNAGGRPGDRLVLTKPIGVGVVTTAAKNDADELGAIAEAVRLMRTLNRAAAEAALSVGVQAATDVTGFGLLGHLRNLAFASGCAAEVDYDAVPVLPAARRYAEAGFCPGGTHANWRFLNDWTAYDPALAKTDQLLLCDAQTSGGLLLAVAPEAVVPLLDELRKRGTPCAAVIGKLVAGPPGRLTVRRMAA